MRPLYDVNGLVFWTEHEVRLREQFRDYFVDRMRDALAAINSAWRFSGVEAPVLMPRTLVAATYTDDDVYSLGDLALRPETTPGTYRYLRHQFDDTSSGFRPPACCWQYGLSFRREQDQPSRHVRLKAFYQLEFQCAFTADTANDYHAALQQPVARMLSDVIGLPTRLVESDRLPAYSQKTVDVEVDNGDKWMEVCSMSLRTDFPGLVRIPTRKSTTERAILVAEVAIGMDRCVYNFLRRSERFDLPPDTAAEGNSVVEFPHPIRP
jgi:glycyl-tRNA synthetase